MKVRSTRNVECGYTTTQLIFQRTSAAVKLFGNSLPGLLSVIAFSALVLRLSPVGALPELFGHHSPPPSLTLDKRQVIRHWHLIDVPTFHGVSYGNGLVAHVAGLRPLFVV